MKNKILTASVLIIGLTLAGYTFAAAQTTGSGSGNKEQEQTQTANQGEDGQLKIQIQNVEQEGNSEHVGSSTANQNREKNEGEDSQIKNQEQEGSNATSTALQRRSEVANAVQQMLQVADRNGGIGQQVKTIAQTQTQNQDKLETSLQKAENRNGFVKFLIGPNYGEINNAQKLLAQNQEQIAQLTQLKNQLTNQSDAQILDQQIQVLEQTNLQIENSLQNAQGGFSLLGWMFRLFSK